ncbi:MAG: hypothetical protein AAFS13_03200 [Pseudomonadota bacterium]
MLKAVKQTVAWLIAHILAGLVAGAVLGALIGVFESGDNVSSGRDALIVFVFAVIGSALYTPFFALPMVALLMGLPEAFGKRPRQTIWSGLGALAGIITIVPLLNTQNNLFLYLTAYAVAGAVGGYTLSHLRLRGPQSLRTPN